MTHTQATRRGLLSGATLGTGLLLSGCRPNGPSVAPSGPADVTLRIGAVLVDIAKDHTISAMASAPADQRILWGQRERVEGREPMKRSSRMHKITAVRMFVALATLVSASTAALAGPPFQTDDPEPIDFRNYEFYTFATSDGTPVETDMFGPAVEFNWGALPNVHLHIIIPAATILPENNPSLAPAGAGPRAFGLGDIELGIKYRFVQETKHRPMIGTFIMFEVPTGSAARGLAS